MARRAILILSLLVVASVVDAAELRASSLVYCW